MSEYVELGVDRVRVQRFDRFKIHNVGIGYEGIWMLTHISPDGSYISVCQSRRPYHRGYRSFGQHIDVFNTAEIQIISRHSQ